MRDENKENKIYEKLGNTILEPIKVILLILLLDGIKKTKRDLQK